MRPWILIAVAACGSAPAQQPTVRTATIAPPTCADIGVILRGPITADGPDAGHAREAAIADSCTQDKWPTELISCVASNRKPQSCLDRLTPQLEASYQTRLAAWSTKYGDSSQAADDPPPPPEIDCQDVADAIDQYSGDVTVERDWVLAQRKHVVATECAGQGWQEVTKQCLITASQADAATSCVASEPDKEAYGRRLADIAARADKIAAMRKKPASISCSKVVGVYYADATWKGEMTTATPKVRKAAINTSRTAMQKACTADAWDATLRACIVSGGAMGCFDASTVAASEWGHPAAAAGGQALPTECEEYKQVIDRLQGCNAIPQATRDALAQLLHGLIADLNDPSSLDAVRNACRAGKEALEQAALCP